MLKSFTLGCTHTEEDDAAILTYHLPRYPCPSTGDTHKYFLVVYEGKYIWHQILMVAYRLQYMWRKVPCHNTRTLQARETFDDIDSV